MQVDPERFTPPADPAAIDDWLDGLVAELADEMRAAVRDLLPGALDAWAATVLTAAGDASMLDVIDERWAKIVLDDFYEPIGGLHHAGALGAWVNAAKAFDLESPDPIGEFGTRWAAVTNDAAVEYQRQAFNRIVGASDALWGDVRARTVQAVKDGVTNEQLKAEIEHTTGFVEARADAIARTEAMAAYNNGTDNGMRALGANGPTHKEWFATGDARTRPTHASAHGQVVEMDATFDVGGVAMKYPHDPAAPAGEVVHCRCRCRYYFAGDELPDGTTSAGSTSTEDAPPLGAPARPPANVPPYGWDSWSDARQYLEARHPGVMWDAADMAKWDRRFVRDSARWADEMSERFPEHWETLRYVGSRGERRVLGDYTVDAFDWSTSRGAMAHANLAGASSSARTAYIAVNPTYAENYSLFTSASGGTGFTVGQTPFDTMVHEFGHIMHGSASSRAAIAAGRGAPPYAYLTGDLTLPAVDSWNYVDQWMSGYIKQRAEKWGSKYGASNRVEAIAEALNASLSTTAKAHPAMKAAGEAWRALADRFAVGDLERIRDAAGAHQLDGPAHFIVEVDSILAEHGIKARPKWPLGLSVEDAKAWIANGALP